MATELDDLVERGLLEAGARLERIADSPAWAEGPVFTRTGRVRWSDIPGNQVREFDPATGETTVIDADAEFPNGRTLGLDGAIIQCSHGRRRVERVAEDGTITSVVDRYRGHRFNSPNDLVVARDGAIWFTDPPYGLEEPTEGHGGVQEYGGCDVFRYDEAAGELSSVVQGMLHPNGIAFSVDESVLYIADTGYHVDDDDPESDKLGWIEAYDVVDGRCENRRVLVELEPTAVVDGFRVDAEDRLWVSAGEGVRVLDREGRELGRFDVPELVANVCFGDADGRTLFVAASTGLYRIRTATTDAARH